MTAPALITADWLRNHSGRRLTGHLRAANASHYLFEAVDRETRQPIGLTRQDSSYKRHKSNGDLAGRSISRWLVGESVFEFEELEAALDLLNAIRAEKANG